MYDFSKTESVLVAEMACDQWVYATDQQEEEHYLDSALSRADDIQNNWRDQFSEIPEHLRVRVAAELRRIALLNTR